MDLKFKHIQLWICSGVVPYPTSCPNTSPNKCHETTKDKKKAIKKWVIAIDISSWRNPTSGDFAWLYINRVINRSIRHCKGDSCHIMWQDVEHRPSYVSLLKGCFPGGGCVCRGLGRATLSTLLQAAWLASVTSVGLQPTQTSSASYVLEK